MSHFIRDTRILALVGVFAIVRPAEGTTTLISCPSTGGSTDPISHAFYIPSYPGVSLLDLTMGFSSDLGETYVFTLTAHVDTFDGPVLGSATREIALTGDATSPVAVTFPFGGSSALPVPKGHTVAFVVNRQGTAFSHHSDGRPANFFFATGAVGGCAAVETNDSSPPLSAVKGSVPVTVTGDAVPVSLSPNSTFDTGISGWTLSPLSTATGTFTFSPADASGSPTSGSALLTSSASTGFFRIQSCVQNVLPGAYTWGGKIRYSSPVGDASLWLAVSSASDCSNPTPLYYQAAPGGGVWYATSGLLRVPADTGMNTRSIALFLSVEPLGTPLLANFDDVFLRPAQLSTLTVLGAASIHGRAGSYFHTDLWVLNRSYTETIAVTPQLRCFAGQVCGFGFALPLRLAPREQGFYSDILTTLFSGRETAGTVELSWDSSVGSISAWARTYSPASGAPTNGTGIPALPSTDSRARAVFIGLASNGGNLDAGFRSNVGVYNPSPNPANSTLSLFDDSGNPLGSISRTLAGFEASQFNDIFAAVGAGGTIAKQSTLVMTSNVPIFSFVTVIDNQTNDSSFLLPTDDELAP